MTIRPAGHAEAISQDFAARFADDVEFYLAQDPRQLPSRYLYDALGSALFEAICLLPWYPLTRTEARLLETHARAIMGAVPSLATILELGAGSGEKLAALMHGAVSRRFPEVHLVDISPAALAQATRTLAALGDVPVVTHQATYESGLMEFRDVRPSGRALVLLLGSNIGNFDPPGADAFLRNIRSTLRAGDALLLGTDLVKPDDDLMRAYDDPLGVTAAFNRNLLVRINRELGGTFDLGGFAHKAVWNAEESRVEMHLVSLRRQHITVPAAGLAFEMQEGESIWTESSYKFRREQVSAMLLEAGFRFRAQWVDESTKFALSLAEAA